MAGARLLTRATDYESLVTFIQRGDHRNYERKVAHNTVARYYPDSSEVDIILYATRILTFKRDGRIVIRSGGYPTVTTKARINSFIQAHGFTMKQRNNEWYLWNYETGKQSDFAGTAVIYAKPEVKR